MRMQSLKDDFLICDMTVPTMTGIPGESSTFPAGIEAIISEGVHYGSLTVRGEVPSIEWQIKAISRARNYYLHRSDKFILAEKVADIYRARREGKFALSFNLQGAEGLLGDLNLVEAYRRLGVGQMLIAYNRRGLFGDGCHECGDAGLSKLGMDLIREMNRVGMLVDCSHTGFRTTMEIMELSDSPVIFSHSNPKALYDHDRNISDEQARACARGGGVVGVTGVGSFMSEAGEDVTATMLMRQIDYYVQLLGPAHVGIGLDYVHDLAALSAAMTDMPEAWPDASYHQRPLAFVPPSVMPELIVMMQSRGYANEDVRNILGGNWLRVLARVWG